MAILDRVKTRIETDLPDDEIQMLIDEANQDVIAKHGPHANPSEPITILLEGNREYLVIGRPIDVTEPVQITEYYDSYGWGQTSLLLAANDYRVWPPGHSIQRRSDGAASNPWRYWADRVEITYVPVNDGDQREEVIIKLVILAIQYNGGFPSSRSRSVGDVTLSDADYVAEREKLIASLMSRHGLNMA